MGLFGKLFGGDKGGKVAAPKAPPPPPPGTSGEPERTIVAYDANGRELRIPLSAWREKVLKPAVAKAWDDPDALAGQVVSALNDDCAGDVLDASARLLDLDTNRERAFVLRGVTLLQTGQPLGAEAVLNEGLRQLGDRGVLLTNLAKAQWARGDQDAGEATLWRGLTLEPNQENGLSWWLSIQRERGQEAYVAALEQAVALPGAWRAQLWTARWRLQQNDIPGAIDRYSKALAHDPLPGDALMMASGDLGNGGQAHLIPEIVAPLYRPEIHGPGAGMNLLQAYQAMERWREGEALLEKLYRLNLPAYRPHLDRHADALREGLRKSLSERPVDPEALQVQYVALDLPVWCYRMSDPTWLLPPKPPGSLMLMAFNRAAPNEDGDGAAREQLEDEAGRLTRATPLYLAEAVWNWTELGVLTLLPAVAGGGPVVFGSRAEGPALWENLPPEPRWLLTGEVAGDAAGWTITVWLRERGQEEPIWSHVLTGATGSLGEPMLALEQALLQRLHPGSTTPWTGFYMRPPGRLMGPYLDALAQSLTVTFASNDILPKHTLWGERALLEWPLRLHLDQPDLGQMEVAFISGLAKAKAYGSDVLAEFDGRVLDLLKRAAPGSPARRLAPLLGRLLDLPPEATPAEGEGEAYEAWLARLNEPEAAVEAG